MTVYLRRSLVLDPDLPPLASASGLLKVRALGRKGLHHSSFGIGREFDNA